MIHLTSMIHNDYGKWCISKYNPLKPVEVDEVFWALESLFVHLE